MMSQPRSLPRRLKEKWTRHIFKKDSSVLDASQIASSSWQSTATRPAIETPSQFVPSLDNGRIPTSPINALIVDDPMTSVEAPNPMTSPAPAQQYITDAQLTLASTTQDFSQTPQQIMDTTESAISTTSDTANTHLSATVRQVIHSVPTSAGPASAVIEPMPLKSLWYSKRTPKWNDVVKRWSIEDEEGYRELEKMTDGVIKSPIERIDALSGFQPASASSNQIPARLKRWQSTLAAFRGISMSLAALDPHKIAPIICASAFFSIDVSKSSWSKIRLTKVDSF